jgi:antitoxin VapB
VRATRLRVRCPEARFEEGDVFEVTGEDQSPSSPSQKRTYKTYILFSKNRAMSDVAKLFKSGGSQAVRLPKEYRFVGEDEVLISREGHRVVLESRRAAWSERFLALAGSAPDFADPADPPTVEPGPDLG